MNPIEVRTYGDRGPTVVALHGGPGAPGSLSSLARELGNGFQVLEPLQRRAGAVPVTVERHVQDLAEVAPERAAFVGWSWGAMLGLSYAARFPERVSALALVGCGTYHVDDRVVFKQRLSEQLGEAGRAREAELRAAIAAAGSAAERDRLLGQLGGLAMSAESYDRLPDDEEHTDLPTDAAGNRETWDDVLRLQREGSEPAAFAAIRAPVLMLHGDVDPHPGAETRDRLLPFVPHLEYVELDRCGHEPWRERHAREPFLLRLRSWLEATA